MRVEPDAPDLGNGAVGDDDDRSDGARSTDTVVGNDIGHRKIGDHGGRQKRYIDLARHISRGALRGRKQSKIGTEATLVLDTVYERYRIEIRHSGYTRNGGHRP